jgi:hypothetical protein
MVRKRYDTVSDVSVGGRMGSVDYNVLPVASGMSSRGTLAMSAISVVVSVAANPKPCDGTGERMDHYRHRERNTH